MKNLQSTMKTFWKCDVYERKDKRLSLWGSWIWLFQKIIGLLTKAAACAVTGRWRYMPELVEMLVRNWTTQIGKEIIRMESEKMKTFQIPSESMELSTFLWLFLTSLWNEKQVRTNVICDNPPCNWNNFT